MSAGKWGHLFRKWFLYIFLDDAGVGGGQVLEEKLWLALGNIWCYFQNSLLMTYLAVAVDVVLTCACAHVCECCAKCSIAEVRPDVWQTLVSINEQRALRARQRRCSHTDGPFSLNIIIMDESQGKESYFPSARLLVIVLLAPRTNCRLSCVQPVRTSNTGGKYWTSWHGSFPTHTPPPPPPAYPKPRISTTVCGVWR